MTSILELAEQAARAAGAHIQAAAHDLSSLNIEQKSLHDYVSDVDRGAEQIIIDLVKGAFPEHGLLGEEYGSHGQNTNEYLWVVDPLDGTTNFLRGIPHYAVSIGVLKSGVLEHAVIFDPAKQELYHASKGKGAYLNDKSISVSGRASIRGGLLATGVPFNGENLRKLDAFSNTMTDLLACETSGIRRFGAAALDLAYVAAARYDGFWEANLQQWDIAAGVLLVQEAGGKVSDLHGEDQYFASGNILAGTPAVHSDMLTITAQRY